MHSKRLSSIVGQCQIDQQQIETSSLQKGFDIRNEPSEQMPKHFLKTCLKSYILFAIDIFHSGARHFKSPPTKKTGDVLINKNNWLCEYKIIETIFRNYENKFDLTVCQY